MAGASDPVAHSYNGHPWEATQIDRMRQTRDWGRLDRDHSPLGVLEVASFHHDLHGLALAPCSHPGSQGKGHVEVPCMVLRVHHEVDIHPARVH